MTYWVDLALSSPGISELEYMSFWGWHILTAPMKRSFCPHHTYTCSKHMLLGNKLISASSWNLTYTKHLSAAKAGRLNNKSLFVACKTYCAHLYQSAECGRLNQRGTWKCCPFSGSSALCPSESQTNNICPDKSKVTSVGVWNPLKWSAKSKSFCFLLKKKPNKTSEAMWVK